MRQAPHVTQPAWVTHRRLAKPITAMLTCGATGSGLNKYQVRVSWCGHKGSKQQTIFLAIYF